MGNLPGGQDCPTEVKLILVKQVCNYVLALQEAPLGLGQATSPWGKRAGFCTPCGSALALKIWAGCPFGPEFAPTESNSAPVGVSGGNREGSCVRLAPAPAFFCPARANSAASPNIWIQLPNKRLSVTHSSPPSLLCASRGLSCSQGE